MNIFRFFWRQERSVMPESGDSETPQREVVETEMVVVPQADPAAVPGVAGIPGLSSAPDDAVEEASIAPAEYAIGPYGSSEEHLRDELARIDQLVRAQTAHWQSTIGSAKPADLWGMLQVTPDEIQSYLHSPPVPQDHPPTGFRAMLERFRSAAHAHAAHIAERRHGTPYEILLRVHRLRKLFGLSHVERDVLLVCLLPELDARYRRLFGYLQDDTSRTRPTVELVLQILRPLIDGPGAGRAVFEPGSPLIAHELIELGEHRHADEPLPMRPVRLNDRIVSYLLGRDPLDGRLDTIVSESDQPVKFEDLPIDPERRRQFERLAEWWRQMRQEIERRLTQSSRHPDPDRTRNSGWPGSDVRSDGAVIFLHGPYGSGASEVMQAICTATGTPLLTVDLERALQSPHGWERIVDLCYREARLRGAALSWPGVDELIGREQPDQRWAYLLAQAEQSPGLTFLAAQAAWDPAGRFRDRSFLRFELPMQSADLRLAYWARLLEGEALEDGVDRGELAKELAEAFALTAGQIRDALATAKSHAASRDPLVTCLLPVDLYEGCRRQSARRLIAFARRIEPVTNVTIDDVDLPPSNKRQLTELQARLRHRARVFGSLGFERRLSLGKGLIVLFTGSTGTGKTMAAEALARDQKVDLYKVDLSALVSKWVGETEKHLHTLFAEAEDANAIIFFDEAEALFSQRGEVKEAQDRWANLETNYLLQRVEEYTGVVILASNLRQNIDAAFVRRINYFVDFPRPDAAARLRIFMGMFPEGVTAPAENDVRALANRFPLSGGNIKNIVLDATYRALDTAEGGRPTITLRQLVAATAREYEKLGKPLNLREFGKDFFAWVEEDIL